MSEQNRSTSILSTTSYIPDGNDEYINVVRGSDSMLGRELAPSFEYSFKTIFGKIGSMRVGMDMVATPNYPMELVSKRHLTRKDIDTIPTKKINLPNYWAIVTYLLASRIQADPKLIEAIKNNDLEYTSTHSKATEAMSMVGVVCTPNLKMGRYLGIIRGISKLIKTDTFNDENIHAFVKECKDKVNVPLFENLPFKMDVSIEI